MPSVFGSQVARLKTATSPIATVAATNRLSERQKLVRDRWINWTRRAWIAIWRSTSIWRSSRKSAFSSLENCSMMRLNSRTRSTTRARRVDVEKINVPQAEIKTAGVNIALKTLKECEAFCMSLNQSVNPLGELEILLGQSAFAVSHHAQTDLVPAMNQNVGMVTHGFRFVGDPVDEFQRAFEVIEFQITRQPIAFPPPIRDAGESVLDLLFVQLHLYSPVYSPAENPSRASRMRLIELKRPINPIHSR